jgi:hypothetical protein
MSEYVCVCVSVYVHGCVVCLYVCVCSCLCVSLSLSLSLYVHAYVLGWGGVIVARQQEYLQESLKRLNASYSSTDSASVDRYVPQRERKRRLVRDQVSERERGAQARVHLHAYRGLCICLRAYAKTHFQSLHTLALSIYLSMYLWRGSRRLMCNLVTAYAAEGAPDKKTEILRVIADILGASADDKRAVRRTLGRPIVCMCVCACVCV